MPDAATRALRTRPLRIALFAMLACALMAEAGQARTGQPGYLTYRAEQVAGATIGVDVGSGNLRVVQEDLADGDAGYGVRVQRFYNSQAAVPGFADAILGPRWIFDVGVQARLRFSEDTATVYGPDGFVQTLTRDAGGVFRGPTGFDGELRRDPAGTSTLTRSDGELVFAADGQLSETRDAQGRRFTVQTSSAAGQIILSSYGTADGRRANFSYDGEPRVREFRDPASRPHTYGFDAAKRLHRQVQPGGRETTFAYDSSGLLRRIDIRPSGEVVTFDIRPDGRVLSYTVSVQGQADRSVDFAYADELTTVTAEGFGVRYTIGPDGRVTGVESLATGPAAFECIPIVIEDPEPELETTAGADDDGELEVEPIVCPPGQERWGKPFTGPKGRPPVPVLTREGSVSPQAPQAAQPQGVRADGRGDANYFYAGYAQQYGGMLADGTDGSGLPTRGGRAALTVHAPFVQKEGAVHSLAEIAVSRGRANFDVIEVGWIITRTGHVGVPASSTKPRLFVFHWIGGDAQAYNSAACRPFGVPSQRTTPGAALTPTGVLTGRTFAIVHDDAQDRWEISYRGRPVCALPDRLWGGRSPRFMRARHVQWFGEVTDENARPCASMGNGNRPNDGPAASFRNLRNIGGVADGDDYIRNGSRDDYYAEEIFLGDSFLYGGPGGC